MLAINALMFKRSACGRSYSNPKWEVTYSHILDCAAAKNVVMGPPKLIIFENAVLL